MQTNLFSSSRSYQGADLSTDKRYRYTLWRIWDDVRPKLMFIGLNPSTADASTDDATIRRCIGFCRDWGYGGFYMLNLFAYRATDPAVMKKAIDPIGPKNDAWLQSVSVISDRVVFAWGCDGTHLSRDQAVIAMFPNAWCFGRTADEHPKHPLYLSKTTELTSFKTDSL